MTVTIEAIYEQGILRLSQPIPLADGTRVEVMVISPPVELATQSPSEILQDIAAMPLQGKQDLYKSSGYE
jgi:predicted DNA-binding antitoxin AbrB/MazE fold protein